MSEIPMAISWASFSPIARRSRAPRRPAVPLEASQLGCQTIMTAHSRRTLLFGLAAGCGASVFAAPFLRYFRPQESREALLEFFAQRGIVADKAPLLQLVEGMLAFYREAEAAGLRASPQADMLLYQWGVFDWGKGESFEFDITRQFISSHAFGADAISQLRVSALLEPTPELRALKMANRWCRRREEVEEFRAFIVSSPAFRLSNRATRKRVEMDWSRV